MAFILKAKKLDISTGRQPVAVLFEPEAVKFGIHREDRIELKIGEQAIHALADFTDTEVKRGEIGLFAELWQDKDVRDGETVEIELVKRPPSVSAIKRKLLGATLTQEDMRSIIGDIVAGRLSDVETTYFVATGFADTWSNKELYYLTRAMAETGDTLELKGTVIDIHSIGGLPGNRTTMLTSPIAACLGLTIPKSSTRAITSPSGVADTMETLARVDLSIEEVKKQAEKIGATLMWGGSVNMAPADDKIIEVSYPLAMEPYSKMIVSIMAKKVAMGIKYFVVEMPVGKTAKVHSFDSASYLEKKFRYIGKQFGMKVKVVKLRALEPTGHGVGPALEARDVLRVLQRKPNYSHTLERTALRLVAYAAQLTGRYTFGKAYKVAKSVLEDGTAWHKMQEIIKMQGPQKGIKPDIDSESLISEKTHQFDIKASGRGTVTAVDNRAINDLCRVLGAPFDKQAGLYLHKRIKERVKVGEPLMTLFAENKERLELAQKGIDKMIVFKIS